MAGKGLVNRIGRSFIPYTNPRVVSPPGSPAHNGRVNVVVATPRRSGTHLLIDLLLNNVPAYRTRPLYVDLDQSYKQSRPGRSLVTAIATDAGQILKTHLPVGLDDAITTDPDLLALVDAAVVVTVRRDREAVMRSLTRMGRSTADMARYEQEFDDFWAFWTPRQDLALDFADLLDADRVAAALARVADRTGTTVRRRLVMPPAPRQQRLIYANKTLTRLAGRRAPRIDTTIHTLKG